MRSEEEIKAEIQRLQAIPSNEVQPFNVYTEFLHSAIRVEKESRIAILKWVLGAERS
jgi:hypothetical protein